MSEQASLQICNLVSRGKSLPEARKMVAEAQKKASATTEPEKKKESAKDKKIRLAEEIEALGGETPAANASVAQFEQALTAAKAAKEQAEADKANDLL